jgi:integrase/recombinase XerD
MIEQIAQFLDHLLDERGLAKNTALAYRNDLEQFHAYIVDRGLNAWTDVHPTLVQAWLARLASDGFGGASTVRKYHALKTFILYLGRTGVLTEPPAMGNARPRPAPRRIVVLSLDQVWTLLDETRIPARERAIVTLLYSAGLRISELIAMNVADVDLAAGLVRVASAAGLEREIPLSSQSIAAVKAYLVQVRPMLSGHGDKGALFLNYAGRRISRTCAWTGVHEAVKLAGLPKDVAPNTLRNSWAVHLLESGIDLRTVQALMGHADVSTTQIYANLARARASAGQVA